MLISLNNEKGISLVESMVAIFLTAIAVLALMPMQDMAIRTNSRSDFLGRSAGILQSELESQEAYIMRASNAVNLGTTTKTINVSDNAGVEGDMTFTVTTTISNNPAAPVAGISWIVHTRVTWPGNATGVRSSLIATRQEGFQ